MQLFLTNIFQAQAVQAATRLQSLCSDAWFQAVARRNLNALPIAGVHIRFYYSYCYLMTSITEMAPNTLPIAVYIASLFHRQRCCQAFVMAQALRPISLGLFSFLFYIIRLHVA
jgi:hypothetical protein